MIRLEKVSKGFYAGLRWNDEAAQAEPARGLPDGATRTRQRRARVTAT